MPFEAERCRNPKTTATENEARAADGIRVDSLGRVRAYCLHGRDRAGLFDGEHEARWYDAQDVIHVARPWRYDSIRPMPELSPIANVIADMQELNTATLATTKLQAMVGLIINKLGGAANPNFGFRTANGTTKTAGYPDLRRVENMMILEGEQGDTIQGLDLKSPGNNYAPFMKLQLQWIGACLGLPYEFVMMVFEGTSFSGSKALMTQAGRTVENWQFWLIDNFLQPLRTWRIAKAIKEGRLPPAPVDARGVSEWYKCTWQPPPMDWIDPVGQMQTDIQEYMIGAIDLATITRRRGRLWRQVALSKAREIAELDAIAKENGISRADLSSFQVPGGAPAKAEPASAKAEPASEKAEEKPTEDEDEDEVENEQ
jgi:capsid protein